MNFFQALLTFKLTTLCASNDDEIKQDKFSYKFFDNLSQTPRYVMQFFAAKLVGISLAFRYRREKFHYNKKLFLCDKRLLSSSIKWEREEKMWMVLCKIAISFLRENSSCTHSITYFTIRFCVVIGEKDLSFSWSWFLFAHSNFTTTLHTISILLTVTLAVWRYIAIK